MPVYAPRNLQGLKLAQPVSAGQGHPCQWVRASYSRGTASLYINEGQPFCGDLGGVRYLRSERVGTHKARLYGCDPRESDPSQPNPCSPMSYDLVWMVGTIQIDVGWTLVTIPQALGFSRSMAVVHR